jgi:hypothetical protein
MVLSGCSATAHRAEQPSLARYLQYAGPPIQRFNYRDSYTGWQIVSDSNIVMFVGDDAFLLRVAPPCPQIRLTLTLRVANATAGVVSRFDRVQLDQNNCLIDEIRQIDNRRMRHDSPQV